MQLISLYIWKRKTMVKQTRDLNTTLCSLICVTRQQYNVCNVSLRISRCEKIYEMQCDTWHCSSSAGSLWLYDNFCIHPNLKGHSINKLIISTVGVRRESEGFLWRSKWEKIAWKYVQAVCRIKVNSPTNALFIKFEKALKFTLKFTLSLLVHVSVYDHHQGAYAIEWLKLY